MNMSVWNCVCCISELTWSWLLYVYCSFYSAVFINVLRGFVFLTKGRVSLNTQNLERGDVSLRLRDIRWSDRGVYICQVIHGEQEEEAAVGLRVRGGKCSVTPVMFINT